MNQKDVEIVFNYLKTNGVINNYMHYGDGIIIATGEGVLKCYKKIKNYKEIDPDKLYIFNHAYDLNHNREISEKNVRSVILNMACEYVDSGNNYNNYFGEGENRYIRYWGV